MPLAFALLLAYFSSFFLLSLLLPFNCNSTIDSHFKIKQNQQFIISNRDLFLHLMKELSALVQMIFGERLSMQTVACLLGEDMPLSAISILV